MKKKEYLEKMKKNNLSIEEQLYKWRGNTKLQNIDKSLNILFNETFRTNTFLEHILVKVCTLNSLYSTQIFDTYGVAKHIYELDIDDDLYNNNLDVVNKIALCKMGDKEKNFYSFATKYCAHHKPKVYSIYDSFVELALCTFNKEATFAEFKKPDLKHYPTFMKVMNLFIEKNNLQLYSLSEVDKYLWLIGKELKQ
jgi:hypothetical protein